MADGEIGFLGLGAMGGPITARLAAWAQRNPGRRILAYDPRPEALAAAAAAGAEPVPGGAMEMAARCALILACLPSPEISEGVALGPQGIAAVPPGQRRVTTYVEMSTIGSAAMRGLADRLAPHGIALVDSPISGGALGAQTGALSVIVSGPAEAVAAARPVLEVVGQNVFVVGDTAGQSQTMKLANNLLSLAAMVLTSEAVALGAKAGLDTAMMCEVFNASTGRNSSTVTKFPRAVLTGTFDCGATNAIATKDLSLAVDEFSAQGIPAPMTGLARDMMRMARASFGATADMTSIARLYEQWAGVRMQSPQAPS